MKQALLVFLGGGFGSIFRYYISVFFNPLFSKFYLGTFVSNIFGCLFIGLILGLSAKSSLISTQQSLFLATGFCGGFTTFSTFALENHSLLKSGDYLHFAVYTVSSLIVGILFISLGFWITK